MEKHVPMHLRRKIRQAKKKPRIFEVLPPTGVLMPGQRVNVQVKFMPTEEKFYESRLPIRIGQSSQRLLLLCHGQGLEPRLEFERTLVEFGPILPHSAGDDQEIVVRNPTTFPIEFYSLEFDNQYLEEEKVLRLMRGYDEYNTLLLPPRGVNDKLPQELLDFYDEQLKKLEEEEKAKAEAEAAAEAEKREREEREREEKEAELLAEDPEYVTKGDSTPAILTTAPSRTATPADQPAGGLAPTEATAPVDDPIKREDLLEEKMKESVASGPGVGELEITPVSAAIARHLGIDLTPEGKAARNRRGIAIVVNGAPMSGKTSTAVSLAKTYEAALLTLDGVVCDAITNGSTPAGLRARELCAEAARRKSEELREMEGQETKAGGLSVDALQAHTQATTAGGAAARDRKTSTAVDQKAKDKVPPGGKTTAMNASSDGPVGSQVPCSPPPLTGPIARRLSVSGGIAGEEGLLSCVLPEDLLVEILAERLQLNDCHRGVIFDGLETLFSQTMATAANAILKALNNRRFIFFCTLKLDYNVLKEQEKKAQEEKAKEAKRREDEEALWLEEMDEDEYDALTKEEKDRVDHKRLVIKKERIKREQEEKAERERIEREAKEEEERRKEEEMKSRKGRKGKTPAVPDSKEKDKKTQTGGKAQGQGSDRTQRSQGGPKGHEGEKGPGSDRPESHATEKSDTQPEEGRKKKDKKGKGKEIVDSVPVEEVRDPAKEAELLLIQRFRTFEASAKDIQELLEFWDRSTLQPRRPSTPSERSDEDQKDHPASGKKGKGKGFETALVDEKHEKEKLKEQERIRLEKEMAEKAAKEAVQEGEEGEVVDGAEDEKKDEVGIPNIVIDCSDKTFVPVKKIQDTEALPSLEELQTSKSHSVASLKKIKPKKKSDTVLALGNASANCYQSPGPRSSQQRSLSSPPKAIAVAAAQLAHRRNSINVDDQEDMRNARELAARTQTRNNIHSKNFKGDLSSNRRTIDSDLSSNSKTSNLPIAADKESKDESKLYTNLTYAEMLVAAEKLPSPKDVLDGLGMGPQGPPIPPPAVFGVMPYPVKRRPPQLGELGGRYLFVASTPDDPNIGHEDKSKEGDGEEENAGTPDKIKDEQPTPTKGKGNKGANTPLGAEKGRTSTDGKVDRKRSAERKRMPRRNSAVVSSPPPGQTTPVSDGDTMSSRLGVQSIIEEKAPAKLLTIFRWTVPAGGEVTLKLRFSSDDLGQFDQTLNFEIVGTRRRYQMFCRGVCAFPAISKEPRIVFPSRKKNRRSDEIVHKKYILMQETFHFGPLLVGKSREKYREGKFPENMETFTILNTSPLEADISFCFLNDSKGETYLLEPPSMLLKPGQSEKLSVWAYPKTATVPKPAVREEVFETPPVLAPKKISQGFESPIKLGVSSKESIDVSGPASAAELNVNESDTGSKDQNTSKAEGKEEHKSAEFESGNFPPRAQLKSHAVVGKQSPGHFEDAIVCCVRENPEPIVFKVCCDGFRPELELDKKQLHFDKVLLHRKDTKTIYLRNSTQLPVAWKLSGLENLGDDFTVAADSGVVEPLSEYPLQAYFRAMKAVQTSKKMIRMEISDVDNIMGVVHTEPIQVIAEAYDVALDMSFPKVYNPKKKKEEKPDKKENSRKETITMEPPKSPPKSQTKKKGEIVYPTFSLMNPQDTLSLTIFSFLLENADPRNPDVTSLFSVIPSNGKLSPLDRPTQVQVIFKSSREVTVKDVPILKCQVIEPNLGDQGETIASIPVKVSVKAVFSKFNISPTNDINFGSLLVNSKKTRTFTIENKGEFDFKYTISKKEKETNTQMNVRQNRPAVKGEKNSKSRDDSSSAPSVKPKKADSVSKEPGQPNAKSKKNDNNNMMQPKQDAGGSGQSKLTLGMFTIFPAFGIILPNGNQVITVDCVGENQGKEIQDISIDITERDPSTYKGGVPYRLVAEACIPTINVDDIGSIFEEHRVCKNLSVWQHANQSLAEVGGVFGEEERKFLFNNVIVGRKAKARFKISNTNKVPCDIVFTLKPVTQKGAPRTPEVFDLDPPRMQIPNHSHMYATITFTPPSMQAYSAIFEASIEGVTPNQARGKSLTFEVSGEGNLPRINVAKPTVRNKRGQPLLLFKRILIGRSESLPFELVNDGTLPSKVDLDLLDPDSVFMLKPTLQTKEAIGDIDYNNRETRRRPHTASVIVDPGERATFEMIFRPTAPNRSQANLKVSVTDNQYEDSIVQMVGEGYEDDVTFDNIGSVLVPIDPERELGSMAEDDVPASIGETESEILEEIEMVEGGEEDAAKPNLMQFGDCYVDEARTLNLTLTNHSKTDCVRFQWPDHPELKFSPQVCDWDDKIQVVKWVDIPPSPVQTADSVEEDVFAEAKHFSMKDMMEILIFGSKSANAVGTPHIHRPGKKKIVETEPEPAHTEVADSARNLELLVSATIDFTQCSCKVDTVHFKDTLMFQTRVYSIELHNEGQVSLDYTWQVMMDSFTPMLQRSVTFMSEGERPESRVDVVDSSYVPFVVEPSFGTIAAGKTAKCVAKDFGIVNPTNSPFTFHWICEDEVDPKRPSCFRCLHPEGEIRSGRKFKVGFEFVSTELDIVESFWRFVIPSQAINLPFLLVGQTREPDVSLDRSHLNFKALLVGREAVETVFLTNNEDSHFNFSFAPDSCYSEGYASHLTVEPMQGQIPPKTRVPVNLFFSPTSEKEVNFNLRCTIPRKVAPITLNVKAEGYTMNCILQCEDSTGNRVELSDRGLNQINFNVVEVNENAIRHLFVLNSGKFNLDYTWEVTPGSVGSDVVSVTPQKGGVMCGETQQCSLSFCPNKRMAVKDCDLTLKVSNGPTYLIKVLGLGVTPGLHFSFRSHNFGSCFIHKSGLDLPTKQVVLKLTNQDKKEISVDCLYEATPQLTYQFEASVVAPGESVDVPFTFCPRRAARYHEVVTFEINGLSKQKVEFTGTGSEMKLWNLKPIIDGEQWTGPVTFTVEPQQTKAYELTYRPLTMTTENKKHLGSIFFPLPDGSGLLFNLTGSAEAPKAVAKIQRDVPCKTGYTELLSVSNWLKKPQRFRVRIESLRPEKLDPGTTVKGMEYIDVPANSKKDYKLSFYAYKEGQTVVKVTFINEQTGEFQFYEVTFRATRPGTINTIRLSTPVRQSVPHQLSVENPLAYQVIFSVSCSVPEVLLPSQLVVPANSQGQFSFEYQPLKVGEVQGRLELYCSDLGLYSYDLVLTATPGAPEKAIYFRVGLGSSTTQVAKFLNFAKQKTDYICKIDNSDFHVDKSVPAAPGSTGGTEVALDVVFEPSRFGEQRAMLTVSSQIGGEYTFPLFGTCIPPKPQGPFTVKAGSSTAIVFHNVFPNTTPFTFQVDNPLFHLTKQGESIRAKKDHRVVVGFDGNDTGSKAAVMGKLIISCARSAGGNSNVQWVYYLKGVTP
ncbi:hydrocephalus-inducing protein-like [Elysia marginata]|uniref:Hydrocephalus-inducing protein-like n=1 Tax=Elysia marginata TaxID=1093978 RepID=A0AAV4IA24_9GAST|nr:hydrocephalus-inducing protein-like [Elysia marginata]